MSRYGSAREFRKVLDALENQGWVLVPKGAGSVQCRPPGGGPIVMVNTGSKEIHSLANAKAELRRAGAKL